VSQYVYDDVRNATWRAIEEHYHQTQRWRRIGRLALIVFLIVAGFSLWFIGGDSAA